MLGGYVYHNYQCHSLGMYLIFLGSHFQSENQLFFKTLNEMQSTTNLTDDLKNTVKEGWLEKESRFFKSWRRRWFVLTLTTLYSFKAEKSYAGPTEVISLKQVTTIKSCDEETKRTNSFKIDCPETTYFLVAANSQEKEQWIGAIGKQMVKLNMRKNSDEDD